MNFWERVQELMDLQGMERKALSLEANFDPSNIGKGIKENRLPSAETAVKIAKCLGVSVEYLVTGKSVSPSAMSELEEERLKTVKDYRNLIGQLESLPVGIQKEILDFVKALSEKLS